MNYDVFISYSTVDQKIVEGLSAYLEQQGIRCFIAYRDIPKGVVWARAITEAIEQSKLMIVVFSEHFNRSEQVDREIELCIEEGHPILTFKIQDSAFTGAKKYYLKNLNWIDAFPDPAKYFGELCESVKKILPQDVTGNTKTTATDNLLNHVNDKWDWDGSLESCMRAAEQGDADAQNKLGFMYRKGQNVPRNYAKAIEWFRIAAEQGNTEAQYNMGESITMVMALNGIIQRLRNNVSQKQSKERTLQEVLEGLRQINK